MPLPQRASRTSTADLFTWIGIVIFLIATFLRLSWPLLVPPGRGPDLTHHLLLVDYIQQNGHLVHDRSLDGAMGEMAHYTPSGERLRELDRYEPRAAMAPWITAKGRRYAIADLRLLPDEVRNRVQFVSEFGHAAVIARPDATIKGCD